MAYYPSLILFFPLAAGLIIGLLGRAMGPKAVRLGVAAEVISFTLSLLVLYEVTSRGPQNIGLFSWSDGILQFGLHIDRLSSVMLVLIATISILIHLFSIRYMQQERGYTRFHSLLAFTTFALFGMVSSANLLILFIFWQLLSWLVPLLSFNHSHPLTVRGAFRTFIMQRIGDVAFLAAILLAYGSYGTLEFQELFSRAAEVQTSLFLGPGDRFEMRADTAVTLLLFIGAMTKSAQFPLHMWLPDSLYAPTPVTALLHAGIINAGGFLLTRLAPLYDLNPGTLHLVFAVGLLTTILGSSMMLVQNDIKKTLGYSTIGQMGFMIMECGLGAYGLAIFHLMAHGLFKATIFLNCGYVIHAARQEPRLPPKAKAIERRQFSTLTWVTGFITTLILPLMILLAAHGILRIPVGDSQGTTIFLFFGWATSSQAILTLYRLRAVASWKVAASMLFTLFLVVVTYLLAAESFTHFLFPARGEVAVHFQAGALPVLVFDILVSAFALVIILGWVLIYAESHGRSIGMPEWVNSLRIRIYLLLMNRLYLDAVAIRFNRVLRREIDRLNGSRIFSYLAALIAIGSAVTLGGRLPVVPAEIGLSILVAILLPLFPLHGIYVAALTRWQGYQAIALAVLLPAAGLFAIAQLMPDLPAETLRAVRVLALFGAVYGSFKALAQTRVPQVVAYAGVAFFSALWWSFGVAGTFAFQPIIYCATTVLISAGLLLAWQTVRARYGNLSLEAMHGLATPMPRFATVLSLLIMAAVGLLPLGLFSAYLAMLVQASIALSWGLMVVLFSWFLASWYLFRMMQQLLFGPHRSDTRYTDLEVSEVAGFALLLLILIALGVMPHDWLETVVLAHVGRMPWR
ncbi:MAG TPA: proton-conducting transporter membrane subunit [Candidatus Binatia bacterium]